VIAGTLKTVRDIGLWVKPTERLTICSDPDDDVFLECAQTARASYIVTGNIKHFPPSWAGARIVTARSLLDTLSARIPLNPLD
jgi:predicted nucleic acid-binding protein